MNKNCATQDRSYAPAREELAGLIEQAIKAPAGISGHPADAPHEARGAAGALAEAPLPERLIEELSAAQELMRAEPPLALTEPAATVVPAQGMRDILRSWHSRYLALLAAVHRHIFDRRIEKLLFFKTATPHSWLEIHANGRRQFRYRGPIPAKALCWALSGLPADLKRYAFVDFEAGNGRTLLLAARRNFEHAIGYTHGNEACAMLEMNLSQYSRSYMSCRDVRALRGDRDGISIPAQPAVLFFPSSMNQAGIGIALSHLSASIRLAPRRVYLIFENSGPERGLEQMRLFRRVPLPLLNRIKATLFSPASVAIYKTRNCGGES